MSEFLIYELILYLRKSRSDNPDESVEEVLRKHETIIQEFCMREYGFKIPEENIYREVVSGESIRDRFEIKKVLSRIEEPSIKGIVVIEPQRLSRGDLVDCGNLINTLQFTKTLVITPTMTYDMENKMERRFFQDELLRGRDYLEYTKEILMRGKMASINRGCFLQAVAPYGYDKIKIGKDNTLTPNKNADVVRLIFDMFVKGTTTWEICRKLEELGIPAPNGKKEWHHASIDKMIKNKHYIGKITYQHDKTITSIVDGEKVTKRVRQAEGDYIVVDGKHPPIIDKEVFATAQSLVSVRPPVKQDIKLKNIFAGLIFCSKCGRVYAYKERYQGTTYLCCKTKGCSKSIRYEQFIDVIVKALEESELPNLVARFKNGEGSSVEIQRKLLKNLEKELEDMKIQEENQYELLETKQYTQALFERRNKILRDKMKATQDKIREAKRTMPNSVDYEERIATLKDAIASLKNPDIEPQDKNRFLKAIIERIEITSNQTNKHGEFDYSVKIELHL